jgi:hypothetical protein
LAGVNTTTCLTGGRMQGPWKALEMALVLQDQVASLSMSSNCQVFPDRAAN